MQYQIGDNLSIGDQRLLQLADHLENGKLGHERFDFSRYNNEPNKCGTAGCALGECPVLWPEQWKWDGNDPLLRDKWETDESAHEFFGLDDFECDHLFYPEMQDTESFG